MFYTTSEEGKTSEISEKGSIVSFVLSEGGKKLINTSLSLILLF